MPDPLALSELFPAPEALTLACREAMRAARDWPPRLGSEAARELLVTVGGSAAFLMACAAVPLPADDAVALALDMTAADWSAVGRVAWGVRPAEAIRRAVEGAAAAGGDGEPAEPADWCAVVETLSRKRGMAYEAVLDLPLVQVAHMLREGRPPRGSRPTARWTTSAAWPPARPGTTPTRSCRTT
jgi:hypothetical protein